MLDIKQIKGGEAMEQLDTIGFQVRTLSNMIGRYLWSHGHCREMENITGPNGWILGYLARNRDRDIFQRDLEEHFSVRRSTASKTITLMEKKGLLRRERVDYDARLRKLVLTEKGWELHSITMKDIEAVERKLVSGLTEEEQSTFLSILEKLKKNIQEEPEKGKGVEV